MGFHISAVFEILWKHPVICGLFLLLLTPSLFHILVYFSPLLISTALFIVALLSMGPRIEETKEERERWAKGEKPEDNWPYTDWTQEDIPTVKKRISDGPALMGYVEDFKSKLFVWIDGLFKAAEGKPLVNEVVNPPKTDEVKEVVTKHEASKELDMPELETIEVEPEVVESEVKTEVVPEVKTEVVPEVKPEIGPEVKPEIGPEVKPEVVSEIKPEVRSDKPLWDEPKEVDGIRLVPLTEDDDLLEVPLNEPVREPFREKVSMPVGKGEKGRVSEVVVKSPKKVEKGSTVVKGEDQVVGKSPQKVLKGERSSKVVKGEGKAEEKGEKGSPQKHVRFDAPATSVRDVHDNIVNNLTKTLHELESKRRNKYNEVLSRRTSSKNLNNRHSQAI